ncbi:MAG: hypothetical protein IKC50_00685 [Oscillospiraceae bacterium]|nr:hypothetical protein [Oscillospiraceae bacterium]MBR2366840.1 hypothetical protein [Oscillospiraceae bacterium]MBR2976775.1 hypothetical protein [Oscillospiraceae bacterium]
MSTVFRLFAIGIFAVIASAAVRSFKSALAPAIALAAAAVLSLLGLRILDPVLRYLQTMRSAAGIDPAVFAPLLRVGCIGMITELTSSFCAETGELSIGRVLEFGGCAASLCALLPLLESITESLRPYLGG